MHSQLYSLVCRQKAWTIEEKENFKVLVCIQDQLIMWVFVGYVIHSFVFSST